MAWSMSLVNNVMMETMIMVMVAVISVLKKTAGTANSLNKSLCVYQQQFVEIQFLSLDKNAMIQLDLNAIVKLAPFETTFSMILTTINIQCIVHKQEDIKIS